MDETAFLLFLQINLGYVSGNDRSGVLADSGEKHLHLFFRGVLCLVEYYKRIPEASTPHIGKRSYFYSSMFFEFSNNFRIKQRLHCVEKRLEIGVDLLR